VPPIPHVEVGDLARLIDDDATTVVIDVREPDEFEEARAPQAVLIPLGTVPESLDRFPTDRPVYVICQSGGRSARAAEWLRANGVDAVNVAGGTKAWVQAGLPTDSGPFTNGSS
jgi:rhodanese-related sulfurtransferase